MPIKIESAVLASPVNKFKELYFKDLRMHKLRILLLVWLIANVAFGQEEVKVPNISYSGTPKKYEIAEIEVTGVQNYDAKVLVNLSGLKAGQQITLPGDEISNAIRKYWEHGLFSNVKIEASKIEGKKVYLNIVLAERPRLTELHYYGLKKSEIEDLNPKVAMMKGSQVTPYLIDRAEKYIKRYFVDKGFSNVEVKVIQRDDTTQVNHVFLDIDVDKKSKVKVRKIEFEGNSVLSDFDLGRQMKKTAMKGKIYNFFKTKKFIEEKYREDLAKIMAKYNEIGYRDARILSDSVIKNPDNTVDIRIKLEEGRKHYFGNITWVGNTIYPADYLSYNLRIKKGDVFNQKLLDKRLYEDDDAVHNLYMDNGYLFSNISPTELNIVNDTINLEMRIFEGKQATINEIIVRGNNQTNEHVVRREIRTKPGQLFSKSELIRTVRELAQLGFFDPETISPDVQPNQEDGTVDIEYKLEEKSNNQLELSGGWGGGMFVGSLGLKFTNFSMRNLFHGDEWKPLPSGDGQTISLRAQTNGSYYQSYSASFTEPWLGGKRPNSLTVSVYHQVQTGVSRNSGYGNSYYNSYSSGVTSASMYDTSKSFKVTGVSVGMGKRLTWPDDYFAIYGEVGFTNYALKNWAGYFSGFSNGTSKTINFKIVLSRNSVDNPLYPRGGSNYSLGVNFTPPYSMFNDVNYQTADAATRYEFIEFHKWNFKTSMFKALDRASKLVVMGRYELGYLGYYDPYAVSPFEKFRVGGDGMSGYSMMGSETIGLRGYENSSLTPYDSNGEENGNVYTRMTLELRYPIALKPSATIYVLSFLEAGNAWQKFTQFSPFSVRRAGGFGVRIFLPMFGLMGVDWAYGFDRPNSGQNAYYGTTSGSQFHFVIGQQF